MVRNREMVIKLQCSKVTTIGTVVANKQRERELEHVQAPLDFLESHVLNTGLPAAGLPQVRKWKKNVKVRKKIQ